MSWFTSELRVRLAPLNRFKPSSKIFYWPFQGGTSFVDLLCFCSVLCLLCFVRVCLYVLRGHLLGKGWPLGSRLWCLLWVCHFPIGILGQVWYLIVSIPDLCNLTYFKYPGKYFYWPFQDTSLVDHLWYLCLVFVMLLRLVIAALWSSDRKDWPIGSRLWYLIVFLSLSYVVSLVKCGTWLYRFLIFANLFSLDALLLPLKRQQKIIWNFRLLLSSAANCC